MNFCMIHVYQNSPVSGIREILNIGKVLKMMHWRNGSYMMWFYEKKNELHEVSSFYIVNFAGIIISKQFSLCFTSKTLKEYTSHMYAYMHLIDILWATYIFTNKKDQMCTNFWINTNLISQFLVYQIYKSIKDYFCFLFYSFISFFLFSFCFNMNVLFLFLFSPSPSIIKENLLRFSQMNTTLLWMF